MAARRNKSQARRNGGNNGGLPGWAWMVLGIVLALGVVFLAPKYLKSDGDGFFRPQPNPDAQPAPVASAEDEVVAPDGDSAPTSAKSGGKPATDAKADDEGGTEFDFYTLLPGKEVPLTDAELAATERAEAQRDAQQARTAAAAQASAGATPAPALPRPVDTEPSTDPAAAPPAPTQVASATPAKPVAAPAAAEDSARYLLQAGAFQASGQAEELKAKIALLGLGARVESAAIGGKTVYRVRMGPYGTASDLAEAKRKLASGGLPGMAIQVK
ncbi:SPOR domain-containing protein [Lysobacter koreensis]|uniref:SPOR domain-containing protein n=1 Tax=Lysobacter koreensis TaxID=266122 RepID=A0ABW2YN92_9GAMM